MARIKPTRHFHNGGPRGYAANERFFNQALIDTRGTDESEVRSFLFLRCIYLVMAAFAEFGEILRKYKSVYLRIYVLERLKYGNYYCLSNPFRRL